MVSMIYPRAWVVALILFTSLGLLPSEDREAHIQRVRPAANARLLALQQEVVAEARSLGFTTAQNAQTDGHGEGLFVQVVGPNTSNSLGIFLRWELDDGLSGMNWYVTRAMQGRPEPVPATYRVGPEAADAVIWRGDRRGGHENELCTANPGRLLTFRTSLPPGTDTDTRIIRGLIWTPVLAHRGRAIIGCRASHHIEWRNIDRGKPTARSALYERVNAQAGVLALCDPDEAGVVYRLELLMDSRQDCIRGEPIANNALLVPADDLQRSSADGHLPFVLGLRRMAALVVGSLGGDDPLFSDDLADQELRLPNVRIIGSSDQRLREGAARLQEFYAVVGRQLCDQQWDLARRNIANCLDQAERLHADLVAHRASNPASGARVVFFGLPSDRAMIYRRTLTALRTSWIAGATQINADIQPVTAHLLSTSQSLSGNLVKSVLKNYLDWCNCLPSSSPETVLSTLGGAAAQIPWDLPRSLAGWADAAQHDAAILQDQATAITRMRELQAFLEQRRTQMVEEARAFQDRLVGYEPLPAIAADLRTRISAMTWATWMANPLVTP